MLNSQVTQTIAQSLDDAEKGKNQIPQLHLTYPTMDINDAYQIQRCWVEKKVADGRRIIGRKVGLTSKAMQVSVGINEPDYGVLLDDMQLMEGSDIPISRFIEPRIEVELAFVLGKPLQGPHCSMLDVLSATDYIVPAIEVIDSRIQRVDTNTGGTRTIVDSISDNAANAGIVMGGRPIRPMDKDLRWISALLSRNGQIEESGVAAGVLGHPAQSVAWLANKLSEYETTLQSGEIILSGSFTRAIFCYSGETYCADYGSLGTVSFRFV